MQILRSHLRPTESETQCGAQQAVVYPPGDSEACELLSIFDLEMWSSLSVGRKRTPLVCLLMLAAKVLKLEHNEEG